MKFNRKQLESISKASNQIKQGIDRLKILLNDELLDWAFNNQLDDYMALEIANLRKSVMTYAKQNIPTV